MRQKKSAKLNYVDCTSVSNMIRIVTGDDIFIGQESFHPMYGSVSKAEADEKADSIRKSGKCCGARIYGVRVIKRERGMHCKVSGSINKGTGRWVPFRGWVIFVRLW